MMAMLYAYQDLRNEQTEWLKSTYPDLIIKKAGELQPTDYAKVTILYGWDKTLGPAILKTPNHQVKWIQAISAGVDYLPLEQIQAEKIQLTNTSGIHRVPISESVFGFLLSIARGIIPFENQRPERNWKMPAGTFTLQNESLLIYGTGQIGQEVARIAKAFNMKTIGVNSSGHPAENFDQTFSLTTIGDTVQSAKAIVNILPLTTETKHYFNADYFDRLQQEPIFVNVGRGPSVDTDALLTALKTGKLAYAALDVFENEPLPANDPLWTADKVILTPHISGMMNHFRKIAFPIFQNNLISFITTGKVANHRVDPKTGY